MHFLQSTGVLFLILCWWKSYATFSPISRLGREERERLLDGLGEIAERQSGGSVELYITTPIYTARRKARTRGSA